MSVNNSVLLANTSYGVPNLPYYDGTSLFFHSKPVEAASYYGGHGAIQTIVITVTNFVGKIALKGSLNSTYESAKYFDTETFDATTGAPVTTTQAFTITGRFVWMRAEISEFTQGTINSITIAY